MTMAKREEEIFKEWENDKEAKGEKRFVRDGVLNETAYNGSKLKIAFIVKEYPPTDDPKHDLRNELRNYPGGMWCKAIRIIHGIKTRMAGELWQVETPDADIGTVIGNKKLRGPMLESICAFNLDKVGGHVSTDMERLALIAMKDQKFIRRQFEIYDPVMTLCAGTFQIVRYVLGHEGIKEEKTSNKVPWYKHGKDQNKYMVGINHFADRGQQKPEVAIEAIKEILKNG